MEVSACLPEIIEDMRQHSDYDCSLWCNLFKRLIIDLTAVERCHLAKAFCAQAWNIGSTKILAALQELSILSAKEYILSLEDAEKAQLVLNDLLETEFDLITDLFVASHYDKLYAVMLTEMFEECLSRLFRDLLANPELNHLEYLRAMVKNLTGSLKRALLLKHVQAILKLHQASAKQSFKHFSSWINEGVDNIQFTKDLIEIAGDSALFITKYLLKLSTTTHFRDWKFYLILLQAIVEKSPGTTAQHLKQFLKTRLCRIAELPSEKDMSHLLLTARAITAMSHDYYKNLDTYADWYRQYIAEMKFHLTTEQFQNVLKCLEDCIDYEQEEDYLEIHARISIAPPLHCAKLVMTYKVKCKSRLASLKSKSKAGESITIDDSD